MAAHGQIKTAPAFAHLALMTLAGGITEAMLEGWANYVEPPEDDFDGWADYVDPDAEPMLAAALSYAERGWDVFPAPPGEKKSCKSAKHSNGAKWGKTCDPEQIRRDFRRWPEANIGLPTGQDNDFWVTEADTLKGHNVDGIASLLGLEKKHGPLPKTLMAESPSGSPHYYFKWPKGVEIRNSTIAPGVDVRGEGGMVIAPPSVRDDGEYRWLNDYPIADAPQWLIDLATTKPKNSGKSATAGTRQQPRLEMADAFKHLDPNQKLVEGIEYPTADIEEIRSAAFAIPPSAIGDEWGWMRFARALAWEAKMRPERRDILWEILDDVSCRAPHYDKDNNQSRFDRYIDEAGEHDITITIATLFYIAREHGWQGEWKWEQERRAKQIAENIKIGDDVTEPLLPQIMTLQEMRKRLVFIGSIGAVADLETGRIRKKEHALDEYAASKYTDGKKIVPVLKAWIASKYRMTVEVLAWVPGKPQICQPPEGRGPAFNMWRGLPPMAYPENWQEWVQPFLEHVEYLVPIAEERERFLQWLAHIIQVPEVLPHTAYLMITPTRGIGRNLLASILVRVLRGFVAAGVSLPDILDGGFTGRLGEKLLIIVDEAREGSGERRYQRANRLSQITTEEHREINPKYGHRSIQKNCGRWLKFSNHQDAIPIDDKDRREIVIANPTVRKADAYYEWLYGLLNDPAFIGSVRHWLETKDIHAFRPGEHAPTNEAKLRVLNEMMSETERAVAEFKEDCETELTSRSAIKDHVLASNNYRLSVNDAHLTHAIRRAGMVNTTRRIMAYKGTGSLAVENRFSVVIVRGEWDIEIVKKADAQKLLEMMGLKGWSATKP